MYTAINFKTKKALKEAVASGAVVRIFNPGTFTTPENGVHCLEGPHFPAAHTWYASATIIDGLVVKVK